MNKLLYRSAPAILAGFCLLFCCVASAELPPAPRNASTYAFDLTSGLMTSEDRRVIDEYAVELERKTGTQALVVLVSFLDGEDIAVYAHDLFNAWGIGDKKRNDGVLLLCARGEREVFISTGTGVEHILSAVVCDRILRDYAVPKLANGDYSGGLRDAFLVICDRIAQAHGVTLSAPGKLVTDNSNQGGIGNLLGSIFGSAGRSSARVSGDSGVESKKEGRSWMGTLIVILIVYFVVRGSRRRRYRSVGGGCLPFLLGGFLGGAMRRGGSFRNPPRMPPMGGWGNSGGFKPGTSKPSGFKPGGGSTRGGGAGRKF